MPMPDLEQLAASARLDGWTTCSGLPFSPGLWVQRAEKLGWTPVPGRPGEHPVSTLTPRTQEQAHPASISAVHGLAEQPLHTDGAHLRESPDLVVLLPGAVTSTPTLLWSPASKLVPPQALDVSLIEAEEGGVFMIDAGSERRLGSVRGRHVGIKWDPTCMVPLDERARRVADFYAGVQAQAHRHEWNRPGEVLVIDNSKTLHGRAAVVAGGEGRVMHRLAFWTGRAS